MTGHTLPDVSSRITSHCLWCLGKLPARCAVRVLGGGELAQPCGVVGARTLPPPWQPSWPTGDDPLAAAADPRRTSSSGNSRHAAMARVTYTQRRQVSLVIRHRKTGRLEAALCSNRGTGAGRRCLWRGAVLTAAGRSKPSSCVAAASMAMLPSIEKEQHWACHNAEGKMQVDGDASATAADRRLCCCVC